MRVTKNEMINRLASEYVYNMDRKELIDYAIECMATSLSSEKLKDLRDMYNTAFDKETDND